jgi:hypothetical protein
MDKRTYLLPTEARQQDPQSLLHCHEIFDFNAIPVLERHQMCYTRGLAIDLALWFFANYTIIDDNSGEDMIDGFQNILMPFTAHIGRQIIRYKRLAVQCGHKGVGSPQQMEYQIESAMFHILELKAAYYAEIAAEHEKGYNSDSSYAQSAASELFDLNFDFTNFKIEERQILDDQRLRIEISLIMVRIWQTNVFLPVSRVNSI